MLLASESVGTFGVSTVSFYFFYGQESKLVSESRDDKFYQYQVMSLDLKTPSGSG